MISIIYFPIFASVAILVAAKSEDSPIASETTMMNSSKIDTTTATNTQQNAIHKHIYGDAV